MADTPEIPIEDFFEDILGKAMRGCGISPSELSKLSGVSEEVIASLRKGVPHEESLRAIAPHLHLDADALVVSANKTWHPEPIDLPGLAVFNTPYHDMFVNAYLAWDVESKAAIAFDTGSDASDMIALLHERDLTLKAIFLTHTHPDHIADLGNLTGSTTRPPVFVHQLEHIDGSTTFQECQDWHFDKLHVGSLHTSGHSEGGTTYLISGLGRSVAVVGDAVFAGSMGGALVSFKEALRNNREKILTLPGNTILCPGHGPLTTVAEEQQHNPFLKGR